MTWAGLTLAGCRQLATLPSQILNVVQGNGPQGWLTAQSGFKHDLIGREEKLCGRKKEDTPPESPEASKLYRAARPHLELFSAGHLHLAFQPLVPQVPACAPHGQLALDTAQENPQLALV